MNLDLLGLFVIVYLILYLDDEFSDDEVNEEIVINENNDDVENVKYDHLHQVSIGKMYEEMLYDLYVLTILVHKILLLKKFMINPCFYYRFLLRKIQSCVLKSIRIFMSYAMPGM